MPRPSTDAVCITETAAPTPTTCRIVPPFPARYAPINDLPCPGPRAWTAPTSIATAIISAIAPADWSGRAIRSASSPPFLDPGAVEASCAPVASALPPSRYRTSAARTSDVGTSFG